MFLRGGGGGLKSGPNSQRLSQPLYKRGRGGGGGGGGRGKRTLFFFECFFLVSKFENFTFCPVGRGGGGGGMVTFLGQPLG